MKHEGRLEPPVVARSATEDRIELLLDDALAATFPASDPVAFPLGRDPGAALTASRTAWEATPVLSSSSG